MAKLDGVDPDQLRAALDEATSAKAAMRLMVALAYQEGVRVETMSERYGIPRSTIYSWLTRFEERGVDSAMEDEKRPGRPRELDSAELAALRNALAEPPSQAGYEGARAWTPALVREFIAESYGVEYSLGHARRLLRELPED